MFLNPTICPDSSHSWLVQKKKLYVDQVGRIIYQFFFEDKSRLCFSSHFKTFSITWLSGTKNDMFKIATEMSTSSDLECIIKYSKKFQTYFQLHHAYRMPLTKMQVSSTLKLYHFTCIPVESFTILHDSGCTVSIYLFH